MSASKTHSRRENNDEFVAIRDEFMHLMKDVSRDAEMGVAYRDAVEELEHAYSELDRLFTKLQKEKAARGRLEAELEELRAAKSSHVDLVGEEIDRKNKEVAAAKEDRDKMKEWLDRGVAECKRISDEVMAVRRDLEESEENCAALVREKAQLTSHLKRQHEDLKELKEREAALQSERADLEAQQTQKAARLDTIARRQQETDEREAKLRAEVAELTGRVSRLAECEGALLELVQELSAASDKVRRLDEGIASGRIADAAFGGNGPAALALGRGGAGGANGSFSRQRSALGGGGGGAFPTDSALSLSNQLHQRSASGSNMATATASFSGNNPYQQQQQQYSAPTAAEASATALAEQQRGLNGGPSVADTRALLHTLQTNVEGLNDTIFRFIRGKQQAFAEVERMQTNEIAALQRDKMALLASHEVEKEELRNRCRALEEEIVATALTTDAYTDEAFARAAALRAAGRTSASTAAVDAAFSLDNIVAAADSANYFSTAADGNNTNSEGVSASTSGKPLTYAEVVLPPPRTTTDAERAALFSQLQAAFREYQELGQTIQHLRTENARIRHKASQRKIDWVKVNDSRTRFHHLTKEVEMMRDYQRRLLAENEHLESLAAMHMQKAAETPDEAAARRYAHKKEQRLNRVAFEEWRARQMGVAAGGAAPLSPGRR